MMSGRRVSRVGMTGMVLWAALGVAEAPRAYADKRSAARQYSAGTKAYNLGRFQDAVTAFEKAYDEDPSPILLFNIAQAHRQMGNREKALFFYRRYLEADPATSNRADVEKRMAELNATAPDAHSGTEPPAPAAATSPEKTPATTASVPEASDPGTTQATGDATSTDRGSSGRRPMRIVAFAAAGVGAASLATGVYFGMRARSLGEDNSRGGDGAVFDPDKDSAGKSAQTLQYVFLGIGAASVVAGGVLFALDLRGANERSVALVPAVYPGGGGLVAGGRF